MNKIPNIAVVGATGLVGRTMLKVIEERKFPYKYLRLIASEKSAGEIIKVKGTDYIVESLDDNSFSNIDIALFSAGSRLSLVYAPIAANQGTYVIDNSSAWRMHEDVPLVVPEVNSHTLSAESKIIANPNCSTIQLVVVLNAINKHFGLKRVVCSTYQSISGAGKKGLDKLTNEIYEMPDEHGLSKHKIAYNAIFHQASDYKGFTEEEMKMLFETRKILEMNDLPLAFTCVRLPILGGHAESVNLELAQDFSLVQIIRVLAEEESIIVVDDLQNEKYPTPQQANDTDEIYVGRIRKDDSVQNGLYLWIVADNLRKGAATNAVQIAERLIKI